MGPTTPCTQKPRRKSAASRREKRRQWDLAKAMFGEDKAHKTSNRTPSKKPRRPLQSREASPTGSSRKPSSKTPNKQAKTTSNASKTPSKDSRTPFKASKAGVGEEGAGRRSGRSERVNYAAMGAASSQEDDQDFL